MLSIMDDMQGYSIMKLCASHLVPPRLSFSLIIYDVCTGFVSGVLPSHCTNTELPSSSSRTFSFVRLAEEYVSIPVVEFGLEIE